MAKIRFPNEMPVANGIGAKDKLMISKDTTGETYQATWDQAKQFLELTGVELEPIASGALPTPLAGQTRTMDVVGVGPWTHPTLPGGSVSMTSIQKGKLFWDGAKWSLRNIVDFTVGAIELAPIAGGALPTITTVGQDYKMQISGGLTGATFTGVGMGSVTLTKDQNAIAYYDGKAKVWAVVNKQDLPKGSDGASLLSQWSPSYINPVTSIAGYTINQQVRDSDGKAFVSLSDNNTSTLFNTDSWLPLKNGENKSVLIPPSYPVIETKVSQDLIGLDYIKLTNNSGVLFISNKNLFKSARLGQTNVDYGVSTFEMSNIQTAYYERKFEDLFLPAGLYKALAKYELSEGETVMPIRPAIYWRGFDNNLAGQQPVQTLLTGDDIGQWNTFDLSLTNDAIINNAGMVFQSNGTTLPSPTKCKITIMLCRVSSHSVNIGDWVASTRREVDMPNEISLNTTDSIIWSKNFNTFKYQKIVLGDVTFDVNRVTNLEINTSYLDERVTDLETIVNDLPIGDFSEIVCNGDSLTEGAGSTTGKPVGVTASKYPDVLSELARKKTINLGVGGEGSWKVATRIGAMSILAEPFTIAASNTVSTNLVLRGQENDYYFPAQGAPSQATDNNILSLPSVNAIGMNPVTIAGVKGNLTEVKSYSFKVTSTAHSNGSLIVALGYSDQNLTEAYRYTVPITSGMTPLQVCNSIIANVVRANWTITLDTENANTVLFSYSQANTNNGLMVHDAGTTGVESVIIPRSNYLFKRLVSGDAKVLNYPTNVITNASSLYRKGKIHIIWMGQNDYAKIGNSYILQGDFKLRYDDIINCLDGEKKYLVINHLQGKDDSEWVMKYGSHYVNLRKWMCRYGINYANSLGANITRTADDISRESTMSNVPKSLKLADDVHYNYWGYQCVARAVYEAGVSLGYWD